MTICFTRGRNKPDSLTCLAMVTRQLPGLPPPDGLTDEMLHGMRARAREHLARWRGIAPGETIGLVFPG